MVPTLVEWAEFINDHGIDAALERAVATKETARREAERDRAPCSTTKGDDANHAEQRVEVIRKLS